MQSMLLGANEKEMGGCIIGSVARDDLRDFFNFPSQYEILYVLSLGYPIEKVEIEDMAEDDSIEYWRDESQVHHVPKRNISDLLLS